MKNSEKFYGLAYKILLYFVWLWIAFITLVVGNLIGIALRYYFF